MTTRESLLSNAPDWLKWSMGFIERIGFPIAVAVYAAYLLIKTIPENTQALEQVGTVLTKLDQNLTDKADRSHKEHIRIMRTLQMDTVNEEQ